MMNRRLQGKFIKQPLARFTSWRVGGSADQLYQPLDQNDLVVFLQRLSLSTPVTFLGLGSNVLVRDGGVSGAVVLTLPALSHLKWVNATTLYAQAGVACAKAARFAARQGLSGLEFLAGIPGTIGGALAMNAGCGGSEIWQRVKSVVMIDRYGHCDTYLPKAFTIGYRKVELPYQQWFLGAYFHLTPCDKFTSLQLINKLLAQRRATQPINLPSCGSVFCNPPHDHAWRLIASCGLQGASIGGAVISIKHANFIINDGTAKACDIESLIEYIEQVVAKKHHVSLQKEVKIVGTA